MQNCISGKSSEELSLSPLISKLWIAATDPQSNSAIECRNHRYASVSRKMKNEGGVGKWKKKEKTEEETYTIKAALYRRCLECSASNLDRRLKVLREMQPEERHVSVRNARPDRYSFLVLTKDLDNLRKSRWKCDEAAVTEILMKTKTIPRNWVIDAKINSRNVLRILSFSTLVIFGGTRMRRSTSNERWYQRENRYSWS